MRLYQEPGSDVLIVTAHLNYYFRQLTEVSFKKSVFFLLAGKGIGFTLFLPLKNRDSYGYSEIL